MKTKLISPFIGGVEQGIALDEFAQISSLSLRGGIVWIVVLRLIMLAKLGVDGSHSTVLRRCYQVPHWVRQGAAGYSLDSLDTARPEKGKPQGPHGFGTNFQRPCCDV